MVAHVREFNRGWTQVMGLLDIGLLHTTHTLAEARVIFELAQADRWERAALKERLGMDASFLTRVLGRLEEQSLVNIAPSDHDGRAITVALTEEGRRAFAVLDSRSAAQITRLLAPLTPEQRSRLTEAMTVLGALVGPAAPDRRRVALRGVGAGDLGWMIERHGAIYADEYGWDQDFEALVARIVADFHRDLAPGRENAWIATVDGARAGCVLCSQRDHQTAQLRILLVEPWARGLGVGRKLVEECVGFAADAGYSRLMLWTNDVLESARRIYESIGFELTDQEEHHSFGHDLIGQNWMLDLSRVRRPSPV